MFKSVRKLECFDTCNPCAMAEEFEAKCSVRGYHGLLFRRNFQISLTFLAGSTHKMVVTSLLASSMAVLATVDLMNQNGQEVVDHVSQLKYFNSVVLIVTVIIILFNFQW